MPALTPGAPHHTPHTFPLGGFERTQFLYGLARTETTIRLVFTQLLIVYSDHLFVLSLHN